MTVSEAKNIIEEFRILCGHYTEQEFFLYTEAADLLIRETKDTQYMIDLGGHYYERKSYDLALKYYEMAFQAGDISAALGLGYIWYYGRTGSVDYEKAFYYFSRAKGPVAEYKIADMYHHGYYVKRDDAKYKEIIEGLYGVFHWTTYIGDPLPEICVRLAGIREKEGNIGGAVRLLREGKDMLASRIAYDPFFGNFSIMRDLIGHLYRLTPFDKTDFDLYDLYELFKDPATVRFTYKGKPYRIIAEREPDGSVAVCFAGKWYRNFEDMLMHAELDGRLITFVNGKLKNFKEI